ncbi:DNA modification system-associated small protein, partial [Geobacillus stearothermophilus]
PEGPKSLDKSTFLEGGTAMHKDDEKLLESICQKHGVHPSYLKQLFLIEKEYADRNMYTRSGIYKDIKRKIDEWTK